MEELSSLKQVPAKKPRPSTDWSKCVFCKAKGKANLRSSTKEGVKRVIEAAAIRCDEESSKRLQPDLDKLLEYGAKWHKNCYSTFTSQEKLERIKQKQSVVDHPSSSQCNDRRTRSTQERDPMWQNCLICGKSGKALCQIMTYQAGEKLCNAADKRNDEDVKCRLGDYDLIAYEGKYHKTCYQTFTSPDHLSRIKNMSRSDDDIGNQYSKAFSMLLVELDVGLLQSQNIYELTNIRDRYRQILSTLGVNGQSYTSTRVKDRLLQHYGSLISFHRPEAKVKSEFVFASDNAAGRAVESLLEITSDAVLKVDAPVLQMDDKTAVLVRAALILNAEIKHTD